MNQDRSKFDKIINVLYSEGIKTNNGNLTQNLAIRHEFRRYKQRQANSFYYDHMDGQPLTRREKRELKKKF